MRDLAPEWFDARDVARVLRVTLRELIDGATFDGGLPLLEVRPRRYLVDAAELAAFEARRTVGRARVSSRLVDAVRVQAADRSARSVRLCEVPPPPAPPQEDATQAATSLP